MLCLYLLELDYLIQVANCKVFTLFHNQGFNDHKKGVLSVYGYLQRPNRQPGWNQV